jgi:UDP-sugar transporter A1/2/3
LLWISQILLLMANNTTVRMSSFEVTMKWVVLVFSVCQQSASLLVASASRKVPGIPYSTRVAVLVQELLKLLVCICLYAYEVGPLNLVSAIRTDIRKNKKEWMQLSIPALLYTAQNNLTFIGISNLDAAVAQVTYQSRIFFVGFFSVTILGKRLGANQWAGLISLAGGVIFAEGIIDKLWVASPNSANHADGRNLIIGVSAMVTASACTSFASVYFERMLKSDRKPSLWLRNIQLALYSSAIAVVTILVDDDALRAEGDWLHGFVSIVWVVVIINGVGGLLAATLIKYADNLVRSFSQAIALICSAFGSSLLFGFQITNSFGFGVLLIILAILLYGDAVPL